MITRKKKKHNNMVSDGNTVVLYYIHGTTKCHGTISEKLW